MSIAAYPQYDNYKDSDVEWWPHVPSHWAVKALKHGLQIKNGHDHKEVLADEGYPVYGSGGQFAYAKEYLHDGEAILLGRKGTIDRPIHVTGKFWSVDTMFYCICSPNLFPRYAYYYCTTIPFFFFSTSTALPSMTQDDLKNNPAPFPPLHEQRPIAAFLDEKCAKIDQAVRIKEQQIRLLRERRQILIQQAVTRGLNPDVPMKDSGIDWIGQIPGHWKVQRNFTLFREIKNAGNEELPVLSVSIHSGVSREELSEEENIRSIIKIADRSSYKEVLPGDIAYNMMRAWQGGIGAVHTHGMVSPAYVVARPADAIVAEYFELLYRTPAFIWQMDAHSKGITDFRKRLYWDDFRNLMTIVPSQAEQQLIIRYAEQITQKFSKAITIKESQITALKEYKTTLINAAVTGKIKVVSDKLGTQDAVCDHLAVQEAH